MTAFALNVLAGLGWAAVFGGVGPVSFVIGFAICFGVLRWMAPAFAASAYARKLPAAIRFAGFYTWKLIVANGQVAHAVIAPRPKRRPAFLRVPLSARTDGEIAILAHLVSLTPGTLTIDVSPDRAFLDVHAMFVDDPDDLRAEVKNELEARLLELLR